MVTLAGLPAGATTSPASPFSVAAGSNQTVTLTLPVTVSSSSYTVTATGTSGSLTHAAALTLTVSGVPDFGIAVSPNAITAAAGTSNTTFTTSITSQNGFSGSTSVALSGLPAGATTSPASPFNVAAGSSQTVTLSLPPTTASGNYTVTATATSGTLTHSTALTLTVGTVPAFSIALSPVAIAVNAGMSNSNFTATITGENGFSGSVAVTLSGLPAGDHDFSRFAVQRFCGKHADGERFGARLGHEWRLRRHRDRNCRNSNPIRNSGHDRGAPASVHRNDVAL